MDDLRVLVILPLLQQLLFKVNLMAELPNEHYFSASSIDRHFVFTNPNKSLVRLGLRLQAYLIILSH